MRYTFLEIIDFVARRVGLTSTELSPDNLAALKISINSAIEDICLSGRIPILRKWGSINVPAVYETGTVTIATALGVSTITGLLTTFTPEMKGRKIIISGESMPYTLKTYGSATSFTLEEIYINPDDDTNTLSTATAFQIVQDTFVLAPDYGILCENQFYDEYNGRELEVRDDGEFFRSNPNRTNVGTSIDVILLGMSDNNLYTTGTVALTQGSAAITGTNTAWNANMNGKPIRFQNDSGEYIFTYLSATTGTLDRVYAGATAAAATYEMDYQGLQQVLFDPKPDTPAIIKYRYFRLLPKLINDGDICPLPGHNAIISGGVWKYLGVREPKEKLSESQNFQIYQRDLDLLRGSANVHPKQKGLKPLI